MSNEEKHEDNRDVIIKINRHEFRVHRGRHTVAELKALAGISATDELTQIVDGKVHPLSDDGAITIKGGEVFVSHQRVGAAS